MYSVLVAGERRRLGIERHATLGTRARADLPHLGAHRADVSARVFCRRGSPSQYWEPQLACPAVGMTSLGRAQRHQARVIAIGLGGADRIFSGFAWNFARHPAQQKKYSLPLWSSLVSSGCRIHIHPADGVFRPWRGRLRGRRCGGVEVIHEFGVRSLYSNQSLPNELRLAWMGERLLQLHEQIALGGIPPLLDTQRVILESFLWEK